MVKRFKASLIFLLFFCNASAQFEYNNFINFTQAEGLPSNETYYIFRDTKNFMWFATDQGVVRFDGKEMKRFNLPDNVVFKIREDKEGRIWFFTQTGKLFFLLSERIYPFKYNSYIQNQIKTISITDAGFSDEGDILLNSYNGTNFKIKNSGIIDKTNYLSSKSDSLVFVINESSVGKLFAQKMVDYGGFHDTLYIYYNSYKKKEFYKIFFHQRSSGYYGVATNKDGETYFYNSNCLIKLTVNGKFLITKFPSDILDIKIDEENNLFVGLIRNGGYFVNDALTKAKEISFLKDKSVTSINIDYEKGTWFSTLENGIFFVALGNCTDLS